MSSTPIRGPGYGPLEGSAENLGTQPIGSAGRPANTCATCSWFYKLSPGHAAICGEQWRYAEWNDAVPLTTVDNSCDQYQENGRNR